MLGCLADISQEKIRHRFGGRVRAIPTQQRHLPTSTHSTDLYLLYQLSRPSFQRVHSREQGHVLGLGGSIGYGLLLRH